MIERTVLMVGTSLDAPGGMTAVVRTYLEEGFLDQWHIDYVPTYVRPGAISQITVFPRALWRILVKMSSGKVRLVHVHSASRGSLWRKSLVCMLARTFNIPYVLHLHSGEFDTFYHKECGEPAKAWVRKTLRSAAFVVALTERWRHTLHEIEPRACITVVANPTTVPVELPHRRATGHDILFLGRLREKKGVFDLVRAVPSVIDRIPDARFILAGDGELDAVRDLAQQLGVSKAVITPGWLDGEAKDRSLSAASLLVLPSYFEGLPICIIEAMASGIPVVASNVGGIPDILEHGVAGLLVEPGDVAGIADAITQILSSDALGNRLRETAFATVKSTMSDEVIAQSLDAMYKQCISDHQMAKGYTS